MSYGTFGASDYLANSSDWSSKYDLPITLVAWVKYTDAEWNSTDTDVFLNFSQDFSVLDNLVWIGHASVADRVRAREYDNTTLASTNFTAGVDEYNDKWVPVIGKFTGVSSRTIYIEDTTNAATNTATLNALGSVLDRVKVGSDANNSNPSKGLIAEVAIFDKALSDAEINALVDGSDAGGFTGPAPNTVASGNCIAYYPLDTDQASHSDQSGAGVASALVENGSVAFNADHPTITGAGETIEIEIPTGPWR